MTDIVERLRHPVGVHERQLQQWCIEAADEIERLTAELREIADMPATLEAKIDRARRALEQKQ